MPLPRGYDCLIHNFGLWRSLVAHLTGGQGVVGSNPASPTMSIRDIPITTIDGVDTSLSEYSDKAVLIVNVASRCGLSPQYEKLEDLQRTYGDQGFIVLGFPSNQFRQELSSETAIKEYCSTTWGIHFSLVRAGEGERAVTASSVCRVDQDTRQRRKGGPDHLEFREVPRLPIRRGTSLPPDDRAGCIRGDHRDRERPAPTFRIDRAPDGSYLMKGIGNV